MSSSIAFALAALLAIDEGQPAASVSIPQLEAQPQGGLATAPQQIGDNPRSAEAPPSLSSAADSRALAAPPIGGRDRCDPAPPQAGANCADRLETRAGDYAKPGAAPVTPEARLLIMTGSPDAAAARGTGAQTGIDALAGPTAAEIVTVLQGQARPDATPAPAGSPAPSVVVLTPH